MVVASALSGDVQVAPEVDQASLRARARDASFFHDALYSGICPATYRRRPPLSQYALRIRGRGVKRSSRRPLHARRTFA